MSELLEILDHTVGEIETSLPKYVHPSETVKKAITLMRDNKIGACLVIDESIKLLGIITERDILNYIVGDEDALSARVDKFMTKNPQTIKANESAVVALQMMSHGNFRNLPVVNMDDKPCGILSASDLMKFFAQHLSDD